MAYPPCWLLARTSRIRRLTSQAIHQIRVYLAGIAFQEGAAISLGSNLILPEFSFHQGGMSYSPKTKTLYDAHVFASYHLPDSPIALGIGMNVPFGLGSDWRGSGAPFSLVSAGTASVTFTNLEMFAVNPVISWRFSDHWAMALGAVLYRVNQINLDNHALLISGNGHGWGANAALLYRGEMFNFGLSYRSRVKVNYDGAIISGPVLAAPLLAGGTGIPAGSSVTARSSSTFPDIISVGLAWHPNESWLISAQMDWTNWKTFDVIDINFNSPLIGDINPLTGQPIVVDNTRIILNWKAIPTISIGTQWAFASDKRLRFGYSFEPAAGNDINFSPRVPGDDHHTFSSGFGMDFGKSITFDLAYSYLLFRDHNQTISGTTPESSPLYNGLYKSQLHVFSGTLSYRF